MTRRKKGQRPPPARELVSKARVAFAVRLRTSEGKRYGYIRSEIMEHFKVSRTQAELDISRCDTVIAEELEKDLPSIKGRMVARIDQVIGMAIEAGDVKGAIMGIAELRDWVGIGSTVNVSGGSPDEKALLGALKLTPAQRKARERELMKMLGEEDLGPLPAGEPEPEGEK